MIRHLRWYICGLLFFATTVNYIDRQVLSILAPQLQDLFAWQETDYGAIVASFNDLDVIDEFLGADTIVIGAGQAGREFSGPEYSGGATTVSVSALPECAWTVSQSVSWIAEVTPSSGQGNGQIEIRPMMYVALSYDHRIVDGKEAVTFLVRVKELMEDPASMLVM